MTKENIKPLIGLDVTFSDAKFYIYPRNYEGYQELLKINTLYEKGVLTLEDVYEHASLCNVILPFEYLDNYETLKENIFHLYNFSDLILSSFFICVSIKNWIILSSVLL